MITNKKTDPDNMWIYLISIGRYDLIELMAKSDRKEIKTIKIKKVLVPDLVIHAAIIKYLERNDVQVIREDIKR